MKTFVQPGKVLTMTAPAAGVTSGTPYKDGEWFGVPTTTAAVGVEYELQVEGVFDMPKDTSVFTAGQPVYWDATNEQLTDLAGGTGAPVAVTTESAATGVALVEAKILPPVGSDAAGNYVANGKFRLAVDYTDISAIGAAALGSFFPDNSRIFHSFIDVTTTFTSATDAATISIGFLVDDVAGVRAATAISTGTSWDAGLQAGIQVGAVATASERLTAARQLNFVTAVEVLTAGAMVIYGDYYVSQ
jgi:predicted RecA/RadA family phage recombinase